ncbi:MAG: ribulose-phosphate 3-epimerase [Bacilli bacterium]|nr:ribulose-phosphate 3-epimerase [Bacilli bacterium]MDD4809119.1 ribulose-phosphate 3-epimerase [Bacilli bacterium]
MKISASFLSIKDNLKENILILDQSNIDYLHLDIMDGIFVHNTTWDIDTIKDLLINTKKPKDVHLMVSDVKKYIDDFSTLNPEYITIHFEAVSDIESTINYIKSKNIKVGLSIKPMTDIVSLIPFLSLIDLVLIMSVEPGEGGQNFIEDTSYKIDILKQLRDENNYYNYVIEVDGGINDETIKLCSNVDIAVVGSYITNSDDYNEQINKLK